MTVALFVIVLASVHAVIFSQHRFYVSQARIAETRAASRIAAGVLAGELRGASSSGGDLYIIASDSVALRSAVGYGVVCGVDGQALRLWRSTGTFGSSVTDSVIVFLEHDFATAEDDEWGVARINAVKSARSDACGDGFAAEYELELDRELEGVTIGSPVRAFRPYVYKLYRGSGGNWWLGQRLRQGRLQPVVGPFAPPASGGLRLEYLNDVGAPTTDRHAVVRVRISVVARSERPIPRRNGLHFSTDSLSTVVFLRNS